MTVFGKYLLAFVCLTALTVTPVRASSCADATNGVNHVSDPIFDLASDGLAHETPSTLMGDLGDMPWSPANPDPSGIGAPDCPPPIILPAQENGGSPQGASGLADAPELSTLALVGGGLVLLGGRRGRRRVA